MTHGASLAQPHALLLRCDGGTVAALTVTHSNTTVILVGGTNLLEEIFIIIIIIIIYLTAIGLSPGGSGYYACTYHVNMK